MPLSDDDKRRIEREFEEEQYRKELEAAAKEKHQKENPGFIRRWLGFLKLLIGLCLVGLLVRVLLDSTGLGEVFDHFMQDDDAGYYIALALILCGFLGSLFTGVKKSLTRPKSLEEDSPPSE